MELPALINPNDSNVDAGTGWPKAPKGFDESGVLAELAPGDALLDPYVPVGRFDRVGGPPATRPPVPPRRARERALRDRHLRRFARRLRVAAKIEVAAGEIARTSVSGGLVWVGGEGILAPLARVIGCVLADGDPALQVRELPARPRLPDGVLPGDTVLALAMSVTPAFAQIIDEAHLRDVRCVLIAPEDALVGRVAPTVVLRLAGDGVRGMPTCAVEVVRSIAACVRARRRRRGSV